MQKTIAVLGPTNTGKTHLAVERMLAHQTGMIGLPLRLLAREIYDRIIKIRKPSEIALITGEERIVPKHARYFICTVEAMPGNLEVEFLAIDEIQLAADGDRGHVFTDRLLHKRGLSETMFLGAATMKASIERLLPDTNFIQRPRFSKLTYAGQKKITRLPPRSAIVAFNADSVYAIAELIRRQRGGAAVVLGALSPRTRNAQVELYQSGEVDFLVATDAIGMGLNMDVNHIAFAGTQKFDGIRQRELHAAELAQIAGRAGRYMNDGTFGVTGNVEPLDGNIVAQIEDHRFKPERILQWRNTKLDYSAIPSLVASLNQPAEKSGLARTHTHEDQAALEQLSRDNEIQNMASSHDTIKRLWEVCQLPDYRKLATSEHATLIGQIYRFLMSDSGTIPTDWLEAQLAYTDRTQGDIDTLANRISHIRTWTYVANRRDWLDEPEIWREKTRAIEDRLSDALHECLAQRFIDRRTSVLAKRLRDKEDLMSKLTEDGGIYAEDQYLGRLLGFHFLPDTGSDSAGTKVLRAASLKIIAQEIEKRANALSAANDDQFELQQSGAITWRDDKVARLEAGANILKPRINLIADNQLSGSPREAVQKRLEQFISAKIANDLDPLIKLDGASDLTGLARGLAFRLVEDFGILPREQVLEEVRELDQAARKTLRKYGVRFGAYHIFMPALLKSAATSMNLILWALKSDDKNISNDQLPLVEQGLTSVPLDRKTPKGFYQAIGFRICGKRCVRIDMLERLADLIRPRIFWKPKGDGDQRPEGSIEDGGFSVIPDMMSLVGCSGDEFADILRTLGYRCQKRKLKPAEIKQAKMSAPEVEDQKPEISTIEVWLPSKKAYGKPHSQKKSGKHGSPKPSKKTKPPKRQAVTMTPSVPKTDPSASPFAALEALRKPNNNPS